MPKLPSYKAPNDEISRVVVSAITGHASDPTHAILRGHLLIEQFLNDFIREHVEHPDYLDKAGLRFVQKLRLSQAMYSGLVAPREDFTKMWELVTKLNSLRNDLAHQGFGEMDQSKLRRFEDELRLELGEISEQFASEQATIATTGDERQYTELEFMLAMLCARVAVTLSADAHFKPILNEAARKAGFPPLTK